MAEQEKAIHSSLTASLLVAAHVEAALDDWERCAPADITPDAAGAVDPGLAAVAFDILVGWYNLRRMEPAKFSDREAEIIVRVQKFVQAERKSLLVNSMRYPVLVDFETRALSLEVEAERIVVALGKAYQRVRQTGQDRDSDPEVRELRIGQSEIMDAIVKLFVEADDARLWCNAAVELDFRMQWLNPLHLSHVMQRSVEVDNFISKHNDLFMPAAPYASNFVASFRSDLEECDIVLEETTQLYRIFAQLHWDVDHDGLTRTLEAIRVRSEQVASVSGTTKKKGEIGWLDVAKDGLLDLMQRLNIPPQPALQFGGGEQAKVVGVLWWMSPDKSRLARLVLTSTFTRQDSLEVGFFDCAGNPSDDFNGQILNMEQVSVPIQKTAAFVQIAALRGSPPQPYSVSVDRIAWVFLGETMELWPPPKDL